VTAGTRTDGTIDRATTMVPPGNADICGSGGTKGGMLNFHRIYIDQDRSIPRQRV
jgi:hypothetical protein